MAVRPGESSLSDSTSTTPLALSRNASRGSFGARSTGATSLSGGAGCFCRSVDAAAELARPNRRRRKDPVMAVMVRPF